MSQSTDATVEEQAFWPRWRRTIISCFIVFHFSLITMWLFARTDEQKNFVLNFRHYIWFLALDQYFGMFAPPRTVNVNLIGIVTYEDGTTKLWFYPRMERLGLLERMPKERYRKFFNDFLAWKSYAAFWNDMARFVARQNNIYPGNKPLTVCLIRYSGPVPPPHEGLGKPLPANTISRVMTTYTVLPEDLQ